jgi:epoxyqueuosine reductase
MAAISRYAWGEDYHDVLREGLEQLVSRIRQAAGAEFDWKICVDTAPLLERAYARYAGLGWIGKNTCLISQAKGSWFFLGELLLSLDLDSDAPPPDRCGTCTRCRSVPNHGYHPRGSARVPDDRFAAASPISPSVRGLIPADARASIGANVPGRDIRRDGSWNSPAPRYGRGAAPLEKLAALTEEEFREMFRRSR